MKKSRFSGKKRLNLVRLICCRSSSTWAKSVRNVASTIRLRVSPYLKSKPAFDFEALSIGSLTVRSVVSELTAYGFSSTFFDCAGVSMPTTVAADAIRLTPPVPSAAGTSDRYDISFFHFTRRRRLMPQVCGPLPW